MFEIKNNEKRIRSHLEGLSVSEIPVKISCCKCRNCGSVMEQKAYRVSAKRDLYARSSNGLEAPDDRQSTVIPAPARRVRRSRNLNVGVVP